jgi:hypothetical protein
VSHIASVEFPPAIQFGAPFKITIHYETDASATSVDVTALSHLDVNPEAIQVDPNETSQDAQLTVAAPPGGGSQVVLVRFTLGASEWTSGASAT